MQGATEALARFAATTKLEDVPPAAVQAAKLAILDTLAVTLVGARDGACQLLAQWVKDQGAGAKATVIGQGFRSSPLLAALANGHAAHALDLDGGMHLSTQTLPAALAQGEASGLSGPTLLLAYLVGRETGHRLDAAFDAGRNEGKGPTYRGWHHTGTNGSLAAAASAGVVLGLDTRQMQMAFGIAAQGASGLRANMGTMAKALVAGNAARNGVMAASLAQQGFLAEEAILETREGLANAFCLEGECDWTVLTRDLGTHFELERGETTKEYACCTPAHRPVEAVLTIAKEHGLRAEDVDAIETDPHSFSLRRERPADGQGGQYSLRYCLAVALLDGEVGWRQMTDERVRAEDVQQLMDRLRIVPLPEAPHLGRGGKERVTIILRDGRRLTTEIGQTRRLSTREEIEPKFFDCAVPVVGREKAERLRDLVLDLERVPSIGPLMTTVQG